MKDVAPLHLSIAFPSCSSVTVPLQNTSACTAQKNLCLCIKFSMSSVQRLKNVDSQWCPIAMLPRQSILAFTALGARIRYLKVIFKQVINSILER